MEIARMIRDQRWTILAALAVLAVYAVSLGMLPKRVFWMPDEGAKFMEMCSVHATAPHYEVPFPARRIDPGFEFLPQPELFPHPSITPAGTVYLAFQSPVLFPFLSGVSMRVFGLTGIYLLPLLCGWGVAVLSGALMLRLHPRWAPCAVLLVGLATPVWFYSMVFWEHTIACFFALLAVYVAVVAPRRSAAAVTAVTAGLTAAIILRIEMVAFAVAVFLAWGLADLAARPEPSAVARPHRTAPAPRPRWLVHLLLVALVLCLLLVLARSLTPRHRVVLALAPARIGAALGGLWRNPRSLVEVFVHGSISEAPAVGDGIPLAVAIGLLSCGLAAFVTSARAAAALMLPGYAALLGFSLFLLCTTQGYRSLHGLFPVAPFLAVWPYALAQSWRERSHARLVLANLCWMGLATGLVAIAGSYISRGRLDVGMEWGQRYLLVLYPVLALATVASLPAFQASARPRWLRGVFGVAVAAMMLTGVGLEIRGLRMLYDTRQQLSKWEQALRADGPVVTDVWWLPSAVAVLFTEQEMFFTNGRAHMARWVELAAAQGVRHFIFASLSPVAPHEFETRRLRPVATRVVDGLHLTSFDLSDGATAPSP
jgi:hypothetical protein